ncbi:hypothetical protein ILUMI_00857 [Ignelater luminosus]|uniref:Uncharacterized protein n=1 Tax=Ignelater luminosus TaxID=2038154 RepID=A0A8K0DFM9_IGNLU|nr:hypothetical protein ILUMI_00857 [Ignelater luminosus]
MNARSCQKITPYDLAGLFNKAYGRVSILEKVTKGFERSGIWPLKPETFGEKDFLPARNLRSTITANEEPTIQISVAIDDENAATSSSALSSAIPRLQIYQVQSLLLLLIPQTSIYPGILLTISLSLILQFLRLPVYYRM